MKRGSKKALRKRTHGGARRGAGRPTAKLPADVIARLGPPPMDGAQLRVWNSRLLAEVQWLSVQGKISTELAASIRANSGAIDRSLPPAPPPRPVEDQDEEEDEGPELEEDASDGGLRIQH